MTEVGYQTSIEGELFIKPVTFTKKGLQIIGFESTLKPVSVQIDPFYRVPQVNLENCSWIINGK